MCGIAGYSLSAERRRPDARGAGAPGRDRRARRRRRRLRLSGPAGRVSGRHEAADAREPSCSSASRAGARDRAPRPRPRLHEGPPLDPGQQPPGPPRAGRRDPQRDHPERRRAARAPHLRALRAADDRRLGGDLRLAAHSQNDPRALEELAARWRRPGSTRACREPSSPHAAPAGRSGSAAAARDLLRLDPRRARDRSRVHRRAAPDDARCARARSSRCATAASPAPPASAPIAATSRRSPCRPCARRGESAYCLARLAAIAAAAA